MTPVQGKDNNQPNHKPFHPHFIMDNYTTATPIPPTPQQKPDSNLVWAILSIFCCWPFAIVAIVKAAQVDGLWARGEYAAAQDASAQAKKWALISLIVGIAAYVIYFLFYAVIGCAALASM